MRDKEYGLVSIVLTLYNKKLYIEDAIFSVYQQTYTNWELIILDDCSTDGSFEIAKSFVEKLGILDKCKLIKNEKNLGLNENTKKGFDLANGDYVCILDADDIYVKNKLERCLLYCRENSVYIVHSDLCVIDGDNLIKAMTFNLEGHKKNSVKRMIPYGQMTASAIFLKRELVDKIISIGFPNKEVRQDQRINICAAIQGYEIGYIKEPLVYYRKVPGNMSYIDDYSNKNRLKNRGKFFIGLKTKYIYILNHIEIDEKTKVYLLRGINLCDLYIHYINGNRMLPSIKLVFMSMYKDYRYFTWRLPILVVRKIISIF